MLLSVNEAFVWLEKNAEKKNVSLKYSDKDFFVSLVLYCEKHGNFDSERGLPFVEISVASLCSEFKLSSHVVQSAITSLCDCGVLERFIYPRCFRVLPNGKIIKNKPSRIYVNFPFFERW